MDKKRILVIEDDNDIRDLLFAQLTLAGYDVATAPNGKEALDQIVQADKGNGYFTGFIIDWMLPQVSGLDICKFIRNQTRFNDVGILLVTALAEKENVIEGLDAGADDYITKPFDMEELLARVRALMRRGPSAPVQQKVEEEKEVYRYDTLEVYPQEARVVVDEAELQLTRTEFYLLSILMGRPGVVHSRSELIKTTQGDSTYVTERTVDTHIASLRKKIGRYGKKIETIRGIGYRFANK